MNLDLLGVNSDVDNGHVEAPLFSLVMNAYYLLGSTAHPWRARHFLFDHIPQPSKMATPYPS